MNVENELKQVNCVQCGIPFAITDHQMAKLRMTHKVFYCPSGHGNVYTKDTEVDILKKELDKKTKELLSLYAELKRKDQELANFAIEIINLKKKTFFGLFSK